MMLSGSMCIIHSFVPYLVDSWLACVVLLVVVLFILFLFMYSFWTDVLTV